jgi:hypothetical protein
LRTFSLVTFGLRAILLLAPAFFSCASLHAQVRIGDLTAPAAGAILDLNSTAKGGLLLSNVNIVDLDFIPDGDSNVFPNVDPDSLDENWGLRGALAYNTNATTGVGIYVWTGKYWMPATETETTEQILFTVRTAADETYKIPTCGYVGGTYNHTYDWNISVDGEPAVHRTGTGGATAGITLSDLPAGDHQIRITPYSNPAPGWGNAYGHSVSSTDEKLISIDAPLTTLAFAPKTTETDAATNASSMFSYLFMQCTNLTAPAVIKDTYKLPATVTDLSRFAGGLYRGCTSLAVPQDLTPLKGWLDGNNSIRNLGNFFWIAYFDCISLTAPQDFTPLSGWFSANTSIADLSFFFSNIHACLSLENTSLTAPVNLAPLSGWFSANTTITNLGRFLFGVHYKNTGLTAPVNLAPLSGWFSANTSITDLSYSFESIHNNNTSLTAPINLAPLSGWFSANTTVTDLTNILTGAHDENTSLKLSGQIIFPNWLKTMKQTDGQTAKDVGLYRTFYLSTAKSDDTGEPKFQDGTSLSSMGTPSSNRQTYGGRTGIVPENLYWQ